MFRKTQSGNGTVIENQISTPEYIIKVTFLCFSASGCGHLAVIVGTLVAVLRPQWEAAFRDKQAGQGWREHECTQS